MKIKLLHIQVLPILSGVQRVSLNIIKTLDPEKYETWLICAPDPLNNQLSFITEATRLGVKVVTLPSLKREIGFHDLKAFWEIYRFIRREKFDVVHTQSSKPGILGRLAARLAGCPRILHTVQGLTFNRFENLFRRIFYIALEMIAGFFCDKIVMVNKSYLRNYWFIPRRRKLLIHNAIDFNGLYRKKDRHDDLTRLIFVGRLEPAKAPLDFVRAMEIVTGKDKKIVASIVGDGQFYSDIARYIKERKLEDNISLLGWRDDVAHLLAEHDIFCLTSIQEAFGLVFCEAGYTGLPSVATRVEGIPDVVLDGKTGLLVPPRRPELFAAAVLKLAKDRKMQVQMGREAHKYIAENFNLERFSQAYKEIYEH